MEPTFKGRLRPTLILGFLYFNEAMDATSIRSIMHERLVSANSRFRSKAVLNPSNPKEVYFEELLAEDIDMNYHVQLKESIGWTDNEVDVFMKELYARDMDADKPLWVSEFSYEMSSFT